MKARFTLLAIATTTLLLGSLAQADLAPPDTEPCVGKAEGDACTYGGAGTCRQLTCSKLDYANWNRDASAGPPTTTYACMTCVTATTTGTGTSTASTTSTGTTTAGTTSTSTTTGTSTSSNDSGWCSVGKQTPMSRIAPWLMGGAFSLLFLFGRRRKQG